MGNENVLSGGRWTGRLERLQEESREVRRSGNKRSHTGYV